MTTTQKTVLDLLGEALFGVPADTENLGTAEWEAVYREADKQTVIPTTVYAVPPTADRELRLHWIDHAWANEIKMARVVPSHRVLCEILARNNIPFVVLKGIRSGSYYPEYYMRRYGDIDFLVSPDDVSRVKEVLTAEGFSLGAELPFEFSMKRDGVSFDVHTEINGTPTGKCGEAIAKQMEDVISSAVSLSVDGMEIPVPDEFHHGLILLLHTAKHMVGFGAGLRQLCDWAVFVNHMGERFEEVFRERLTEGGLWRFACVMSSACVKYLHMTPYTWITETDDGVTDDAITERFMDDLMRKGNLRHDGGDDMDSVFIAETNKGGVARGNMFTQMLKNLAGKVCWQWPYMKKWKIMIPFGIFWMCVRYCFGVLTGTYRKTDIKGTIETATKRKQLYEELELFREDDK